MRSRVHVGTISHCWEKDLFHSNRGNTDADILGRWISLKEFLPNVFYFLFEKGMMVLAEKGGGQGTPGLEVLGRLGKV